MNCFCTPQNNASGDSCCKANDLCSFSGNLDDVTATPIYVQSVYDAVRFHMQGMKTVQNLKFTPAIPPGCSVSRILDIRCKKVFDPSKASDRSNLTLDMETGISGAYFVNECNSVVETVGPDGVPSEKILFADTSECDSTGGGTPILKPRSEAQTATSTRERKESFFRRCFTCTLTVPSRMPRCSEIS